MLQIYTADISALPDQPGRLPLSDYRMAQLSSCRSPQRRRQGIAAELLLIHALRENGENCALPLSIRREPDGKPVLTDSELFFNLSHCRSTAVCAVSDTPVGIDLEAERPLQEAVLRRCFSQQEQRWILASDSPSSAFAEFWTRKESFLKATGEGLRSLRRLDLLHPPAEASFFHTLLEELHLSVCVLGPCAGPELLKKVDLCNLNW